MSGNGSLLGESSVLAVPVTSIIKAGFTRAKKRDAFINEVLPIWCGSSLVGITPSDAATSTANLTAAASKFIVS